MNNLIYIFIFLTACGSQPNEKQRATSTDTTLQIEPKTPKAAEEDIPTKVEQENTFIDKSKFKVDKQSTFSLENWYYGARQKKLVTMTIDEIKKYFQNSKLKNNISTDNESSYYFFSIQKSFPQTEITLIEEYDICCADLLLMKYDSNNQLISKEKVAGTGGDGGWDYNEFGTFTSSTNYQLIRIDRETLRDEQDTMEYRIDSVVMQFQVNEDFSFTKKQEQAFQRKQLIVN